MSAAVRRKAVGIWIRVSTEEQAQGESPEHHERRARLYAEAKDWHVREVYHLEAVSGKSVAGHPEAQRMLKDIRSGHITGLVFSKLARLARNTKELLEFAEIFREYGADLVSLQESIDTTSPAGRLFYTMIAAMAQWEREEIASRVAASVPIRAKLGKNLGGQATYGYQWVDGKLILDPKEAPVRVQIYELFLEHRRKKTVARLLNEQGHRTRNGSPFTDTTIDRLLRDPTAKGLRRVNYTRTTDAKKQWQLKPEEDWVHHEVEALISEDTWVRCNAILDERRAGRKRPSRKPVHLFAGVTYCQCGEKMYVPSNSPKYICYTCRNKIPVSDLEAIYHNELHGYLLSEEHITDYLARHDGLIRTKEAGLVQLEEEQVSVAREMDKVYRLYLDDGISRDGFAARYQPLEERQKQLNDQLPAAQAELDLLRVQQASSQQTIAEARDLHSKWADYSLDQKRSIVEAITNRINVSTDTVEIDLLYIPLAGTDAAKATRPQGFIAATS
ncbi:MAG: recombinase family protein [Parvibaculum sp.]|uniref:recombinase family protein n=1 Tax=Parvibaculum sp. TaxID=2024848 RepID=UPI00284C1E55|nr:recombinase family protein [Parvibaculum sp.]MDR3500672.1 recombinase family protein [Parvibaculum sp.]